MGKKDNKGTKYDSLFEARRRGERVSPAAGSEIQEETGRVARSRGGGKRSDSDYRQVSAYVRRDTYQRVKLALLEEEDREFSELVEELLQHWLESRG